MTIQLTQLEIEVLINRRLETGRYKDAEDVILRALKSSEVESSNREDERLAAIKRLMTFGRTHGLTLGRISIRDLREEARR